MKSDLLSNIVRKFIDIVAVKNWQVESDSGFTDIDTVNKTIQYEEYEIRTKLGRRLVCADNHILITDDYCEVYAKDSLGRSIIATNGTDLVVSVRNLGTKSNMYDLSLCDKSNHLYYTDGLLSHNTTTYTIYLLWLTMFHADKKVMILANKLDTVIEICERIRLAYQYIPSFLKPGVETWNKSEIKFSNHSVVKGFSTSSDSARGFSSQCVVMDEAAFVPNNIASKVFESIYPVISSSKTSQFIMVSTPNGADPKNLYYEIWKKANSKDKESNTDGWKAFRFDWWDVPGRDEQWKKNTIAAIGEKRFSQEFGNEFLAQNTLTKLVPDEIIEKFRKEHAEYKNKNIYQGKDLAILSEDGNKAYTIKMFDMFNPERTYLITSDVAEGIGKDSSVLYVWDVTDLSDIRMVLRFSDNTVSILEFAYITLQICKMYNNPFLACESNGIALGYIEQLRVTYEYENFVRMNRENGCGIQSHFTVKSRACLWFRDMLTTVGFGFRFNDLSLVDEFGTFIKKNTSVQDVFAAIGDNHDDHIMTMIWACWVLNPENVEKYFGVVDTFTSSLGNIYPKTLANLFENTDADIAKVLEIPQVKEFMTYRELHTEEFDAMDRQAASRGLGMMKSLGKRVLAERGNPNRIVYSQENMLGINRNRQVVSQDDMTNMSRGGRSSGGNFFSSSSNLAMYGLEDDELLW